MNEEQLKNYLSSLPKDALPISANDRFALQLETMTSGESNKVAIFRGDEGGLVVKMNAVKSKERAFFSGEYHKLICLAERNIAPRVYWLDLESPFGFLIIMERILGTSLNPDSFWRHGKALVNVLRLMSNIAESELRDCEVFCRDIHSCYEYAHIFPAFAETQLLRFKNVYGSSNVSESLLKCAAASYHLIEETKSAFGDSSLGLIHTGIHPGNVLIDSSGRARLLDWEHSAIGDPAFELSAMFRHSAPSDDYRHKCFDVYTENPNTLQQRVTLYTELFRLHQVLWHSLRAHDAEEGSLDLVEDKSSNYYLAESIRYAEQLSDGVLGRMSTMDSEFCVRIEDLIYNKIAFMRSFKEQS